MLCVLWVTRRGVRADYIGDNILLGPLRRPFWIELQSRFGNMFYVREQVRRVLCVLRHAGCLANLLCCACGDGSACRAAVSLGLVRCGNA